MIARLEMDFGEHCSTLKLIEQAVNTGQGTPFVCGQLVEFLIVNAKAGSYIFLLYEKDWGTPRRRARLDKLLFSQWKKLLMQFPKLDPVYLV